MGLIKAALGSAGGTFADQWKEYFYCEALDKDVLVVKGQKRVSGRSSNTKGSDNVITTGSGLVVADGQCMLIVEQGKVVEVCAEAGEYTFDSTLEPSIFCGSLGEGIKKTFATIGKRFTYGGDTGVDQRVYYVNTKELMDNKFGTPNPIPFRVVDAKINLDIDVALRCSGVYSYRIADPLLFYTNVCGNVEKEFTRDEIETQLKAEFISALQPGLAKLSAMELRPNQIIGYTTELENAMNEILTQKWKDLRGIVVESIALGSVTLPDEDAEMIKAAQKTGMLTNSAMAVAATIEATNTAMTTAAGNSAGAMTGFLGMGMAQPVGSSNIQSVVNMAQQQQAAQAAQEAAASGWTCNCGNVNTGAFCTNCGEKKPAPAGEWTCSCGTVNNGNFCSNCGSKKPSVEWTCNCGTVNTGKFCSNCGTPRA